MDTLRWKSWSRREIRFSAEFDAYRSDPSLINKRPIFGIVAQQTGGLGPRVMATPGKKKKTGERHSMPREIP